ncbi:hypothetical protein FKW77_009069 [Venturia effusa]|uniref:Uncharacterized protein n=1 Tax=Venturia effusa TaxID=50376 RepID=A0A517L3Z3_9PEZI|nr:hypothetical protein FKW77_009069 [Venturia effusa]
MAIKKLPGASTCPNVLVYLEKDHIYKVDGQALKRSSSVLYDELPRHRPDSYSPITEDGGLSRALGVESIEGIEAFFVLPIGERRLKSVSRQKFLPYLPPLPPIKVKEEDGNIKMEDAEDLSTTIALRFRQTTDTPALQSQAPLTSTAYAYKLLLLLMHNSDLRAVDDRPRPFQDTLHALQKLIHLCKLYDCARLLRPAVANYLHQYRKELFLAIKEDPPYFAILATHLRDESIMTEALIHLVGAYHEDHWPWKTPKHKLETSKGQHILDIVKPKAAKLSTDCALTSLKLFQNSIHVEQEDGTEGRVSIHSHKDSWTVVSMFRDHLSHRLEEAGDDPTLKGAVFRSLHRSGEEYMPLWKVYSDMKELGVGFDYEEDISSSGVFRYIIRGTTLNVPNWYSGYSYAVFQKSYGAALVFTFVFDA